MEEGFAHARADWSGLLNKTFSWDNPPEGARELIPVVRYAVKRKLAKPQAHYWDLATLLELEVLADAVESAQDILTRIASTAPEAWQTQTTVHNLGLIREARERKGMDSDWIAEIETQLAQHSN